MINSKHKYPKNTSYLVLAVFLSKCSLKTVAPVVNAALSTLTIFHEELEEN